MEEEGWELLHTRIFVSSTQMKETGETSLFTSYLFFLVFLNVTSPVNIILSMVVQFWVCL